MFKFVQFPPFYIKRLLMEQLKMEHFENLAETLGSYIESDYKIWLNRIGTFILLLFIMPIMIQILMMITKTIIGLYKFCYIKVLKMKPNSRSWRPVQLAIARFWDLYGRIYYGYELHGLENIPKDKSALIIYFHGTLPIDILFFQARMILKGRPLYRVFDKFMFKIPPGSKVISDIVSAIPGTKNTCVDILNTGNILTIAPGGAHESIFGDKYYNLDWKDRLGFAKVALLSSNTIALPLFTENIQEAYRMAHYGVMKQVLDWLYRTLHLPICLSYGGFPVKLRTHIGRPIAYDKDTTPQQFKVRALSAIYELRDKHQRLPGSIPHALFARFGFKQSAKFIKDGDEE